jgi:phosphohistidine phosphatase
MNIYLIRHGKAENKSEIKPDEERELTEEGILEVEKAANLWKQHINKFDIILSSPLKRAIQTAEIIKNVFNVNAEILKETSLLNGGLTDDLLNVVTEFETEEIAMIGHQPDLANHISRIASLSEINIKLPPATIAKISFKDNPIIGEGILEFLIPPLIKKG